MVEHCWSITANAMIVCLVVLSYTLRLFERAVQPNFYHITTSAWNVIITMTTVGYGDIYAQSHAGRAIAVLSAFIGVLLLSVYVLCIMNSMTFNYSESRSEALLQRLMDRD